MNQVSGTGADLNSKKINVSTWVLLFALCYFFLYCNSGMFLTAFLIDWMYDFLVPPFASMFGVDSLQRVEKTGSGDTQFHYYQVFFMLFASFVGSIILLFTIRKEKTITKFEKTVYMLVRYFVLYMMLIYGLSKVFYLQFQFPPERSLLTNIGDKSPMGLMWTFMGYSKGYTMFVGWLEFLAGLFLIFRRTTVLGALMTFGVMLNVFALNMCYDVPVKLFSFHIVLMSLFLLYPVRNEVFNFFFGRDNIKRGIIPFFDYGNYSGMMLWAKVGLLTFTLLRMGTGNYRTYKSIQDIGQISGKYTVVDQQFFREGSEIQDTSYGQLWESLGHINRGSIAINYKDGRERWFKSNINTDDQSLELTLRSDSDLTETLKYNILETGSLHITGNLESDSISINLKKIEKQFQLKDRGFHWIQEYPYNR